MKLRANRFWGRLYIDGWPQTIQFFRAHFGIEPPLVGVIYMHIGEEAFRLRLVYHNNRHTYTNYLH
jgi:hypothetical protein